MLCVLQVTILRGKDGYGFTICSDSPVRVQAVDPGNVLSAHVHSIFPSRGICLNFDVMSKSVIQSTVMFTLAVQYLLMR